jgi:glycosyltransferase involved in cell wall biosynthesis
LRRARALNSEQTFDLAWHLTFANAWIGSAAALLGTQFVYGPVGGGVKTPWKLIPALGIRGCLQELLRVAVRGAARYGNPLARLSWRRADLILAQNPETLEWLPRRHRAKGEVFPNAALETMEGTPTPRYIGEKVALFAARLSPWKGASLAVRSIALLPDWKLLVAGSGPDASRLRRLAGRLGLTDRVQYLGNLPRARLFELMRSEADVLLFPSMHEDAGWVVAEAGASGLPVVALDRGGPPQLGAVVVRPGTINETIEQLAACVTSVVSRQPRAVHDFELEARIAELREILIRRGILSVTPATERTLAEEARSSSALGHQGDGG